MSNDGNVAITISAKDLTKAGFDAARASLKGLGVEAKAATVRGSDLRASLMQVDGVFAAMGLSIGPAVQGLGDLGDASGKTAGQLGKIGTAGLVLGAATAGWKIGRMAAEFFDLDVKIGNATAKLLGFGDVAGQTAGAKQDTINKAIRGGAAAMISYTDAIAFNEAAHKAAKGPLEAAGKLAMFQESLKKTTADLAGLTQAQKTLIREAVGLDESNASIATGMGLSAGAVDGYVKSLKATEAAHKKTTADAAALADKLATLRGALFGDNVTKSAQDYVKALGPLSNLTKVSADETKKLNTVMGAAIEVYKLQGKIAPQAMRDTWLATLPLAPLVRDYGNALVEAAAR